MRRKRTNLPPKKNLKSSNPKGSLPRAANRTPCAILLRPVGYAGQAGDPEERNRQGAGLRGDDGWGGSRRPRALGVVEVGDKIFVGWKEGWGAGEKDAGERG